VRIIDRILRGQKGEVQVINLGLGRTGTHSIQHALEVLGLAPCFHINTAMIEQPWNTARWLQLAEGDRFDFEPFFGRYRAVAHFPLVERWERVVEAYPDALFILSVRDAEGWYRSTHATLVRSVEDWSLRWLSKVNPFAEKQRRLMVDQEIPYMRLGPEAAKRCYLERNEAIAKVIPADRLLVFDVREGWTPLCVFLGVEIPDVPFPHLNDDAHVLRKLMVIRVVTSLLIFGIPIGLVAALLPAL